MENRQKPYTIWKPRMLQTTPETQKLLAPPSTNIGPRPLSDIRELSEPSVIDSVVKRAGNQSQSHLSAPKANGSGHEGSLKKAVPMQRGQRLAKQGHNRSQSADNGSSSYSSTPEQSSFYSIPHSSVPRRSSSQTHARRPTKNHTRNQSIRATPPPGHPKFEGITIPNRGHSRSPVKETGLRLDAVKSDAGRRIPSRTCVRTPHPTDILEFPSYRHPRLKLELQVSAPLFVGGGSIEGHVKITVDENERIRSRRSFGIGAISVDLLGFEEMSSGRRASFLAVGTELMDTSHPPPANMVEPPNPLTPDEQFWTLAPSTSALPFMISLPLDTGPPPFQSRNANIRFLLCVTALIGDTGKHYRVRTSQDICVLATYDPEKALTSLSSPLTAIDEISIPRFGRCDTLKVTAGLHRQVWVSGSSIFVDVHIANRTHKPVKRLELTLERDILCYKHAPAGTREKSASQARIFESNEQSIITRSSLKPGQQRWNGVQQHTSETRTCELELPRGHATVRCGKYFEVRFFLNVTASLSNAKLVSVQLPIILIHINSLDVLPNSVAQVAAAIEEKRAQSQNHRMQSKPQGGMHSRQRSVSSPAAMAELRRRPSYSQGRAFAAPRQQSTDRQRAVKADIDDLRQTLDSSPRKFEPRLQGAAIKKMGSNVSIGTLSVGGKKNLGDNTVGNIGYRTPPTNRAGRYFDHIGDGKVEGPANRLRRMQSLDSCQSKNSTGVPRSRKEPDQNVKPRYNFSVVKNRIEPHTLGLTSANKDNSFGGAGDPIPRPSTGFSFREKMDRRRFEFKAVRQKGSGSLKERSMNWWEQVKHKDKEKEGWI